MHVRFDSLFSSNSFAVVVEHILHVTYVVRFGPQRVQYDPFSVLMLLVVCLSLASKTEATSIHLI